MLTVLLLAFAAADISGIWIGQVQPNRAGAEPQEIIFKFSQSGAVLSGKLYGDYRSTPIIEGKVTGDDFSFVVVVEEQAGNQINSTRVRFTGSVKGDAIEMTRERESSTNAGNGGVVQFRGNSKQSVQLKRLI